MKEDLESGIQALIAQDIINSADPITQAQILAKEEERFAANNKNQVANLLPEYLVYLAAEVIASTDPSAANRASGLQAITKRRSSKKENPRRHLLDTIQNKIDEAQK